MLLSVTERGTAKRCRWQWAYGSHNGRALTKIIAPSALNLGGLQHITHARWEVEFFTRPTQTLADIFMQECGERESIMRTTYRTRTGVTVPDSEMEQFYDLVELGREMCMNYEEYWGAPVPEDMRVIQPEQTLVFDIPGTSHNAEWHWPTKQWIDCPHPQFTYARLNPLTGEISQYKQPACNGYHQLEGTLDSLIQNTDTGTCFVRERKTFATHPTQLSLDTNDQFLGYQWMEQQLHAATDQLFIGGMAYDGMWKRTRVDKRGKTRAWWDLFIRKILTRSQREVEEFGLWLIEDAFSLAGQFPTVPLLGGPNRAWSGCWDCGMFEELCRAEMRGEDTTPILKTFTLRSLEDRTELWSEPIEMV